MLDILKGLNQNEAQILLSSTALSLMPNPGIESGGAIESQQSQAELELLEQVKSILGIEVDEISGESKTVILATILHDLGHLVLDKKREDEVRARLGNRGGLRPDLYIVEVGQSFKNTSMRRGIRPNHVISALSSPDDVQHVSPPENNESQDQRFSLYVKSLAGPRKNDPYTFMVSTIRKGYVQTVLSAWRIYHSDVDLSGAKKPLDVLKSFAETYGIPFSVGSSDKSKFKYYEKIEIPEGQSGSELVAYEHEKDRKHEVYFQLKITSPKEVEVGIVFVIDVSKYEQDLMKHGVKINH